MSIYSAKLGYTLPPYLSLNWLDNSFPSEEALAAQIADARRHILDQYGFIVFNLLQDPDWRMCTALAPLVGEITDIGLVGRRHRGVIVEFDKIEPSHLRTLLKKYVPIHYQWFPTSTGPFDPKVLQATDYAFMMSIRHSTTHAFAPRNGKEREASPKRPAGPVQKKPAKYYAVESIGEEDKGRRISKNEYKRLTEWCRGVHKSLPGGDIFYAYENDAEDDDDAKPAGPVVSAKSLAAWEAKMAALPREEPLTSTDNVNVPAVAMQGVATAESESEASMAVVTQGVTTAESEASLVEVTQGVTTQGAVNKEPAQVTVTAPIAEAIEVSVAPVPDSGTEPHEEGEAPFIPGSPIAPWIPQDSHVSTAPPSPRANSHPSSPTDARVVPPASMDGFTQKSPRLSSPRSMTRPSSSFVSGAVLSEPAGVLTTPAAVDAGRSQQQVYDRPGRPFKGESRRDAGSSQHYERRTSRPYREEGYRSHGDRTQAQAHSRYRPAYDEGYSSHGPSSNWPSSAPRRPPSPRREERLAFPSDRSYRKRKLSSSQLELRGRTGESKRFCPEDREAHRPTLSDRIVDDVRMGPSPSSSRSLIDRVHTVAKVPDTEQKPKTKQVPNPRAEQVPTLMLRPSMSQVFLQPQGLMSAAEGIRLITHAYRANELRINGPQVFMQGVTFPAAPTLHSGCLITMFRSAIRVAHDLLANPNASPADSIPGLLRSGAPFRVISSIQYTAPTQLEARPLYLATKRTHVGLDLSEPGYWNTYLATVQQLLDRPFARRFLTVGGIIWRIALQFGPKTLIQEALSGPSSDVTRWKSGETLDDLWDDTVTPAELEILLGQGLENSVTCWPPHDIWTSSTRWSGFWSEKDEAWFQLQLANLSSGNTEAPKTRKDWKRFYKPISDDKSGDPSFHGSEAFARDLFQKLGYRVDRDPIWDLDT
ncbi:uncharacterized protein F5891DRAFT_985561 [Suillus fuscotomentosus]|nr:uncharacterized protein F5891DRAFT_985561 [Suillus fuscotomentosus]KAG1893740.1 hypothetical protein F5891DRAFT_985561 [Suillus fuscotomentosus]